MYRLEGASPSDTKMSDFRQLDMGSILKRSLDSGYVTELFLCSYILYGIDILDLVQ